MLSYRVKPSGLQGEISIPPSKSHTLRAILFAAFARGVSTISNYLPSPDTNAMLAACRLLGAKIEVSPHRLMIRGFAGKPSTPSQVIDAGNSGQVLRFIAAVSSLCEGYTVITGDDSIRTNRSMQPLLDGLNGLNVFAKSTQNNGFAPVIIGGNLSGGITRLSGEDSQPVSALLIAGSFAPHPTRIEVTHPGETPWIDLTLAWLKRLGITCHHQNYQVYELLGCADYPGFNYTVPGDFSSCAFPVAAALVTRSNILVKNLDWEDVQGDKALFTLLQASGAHMEIMPNMQQMRVYESGLNLASELVVNAFIDAVPILAVLACFSAQQTQLKGAGIARQKESDRLACMTQELRKMGADIDELDDGLSIRPARLRGAVVNSHHDHRIAMALTVAAMAASGESVIENVACVNKSYPDFAGAMQTLGALVEVCA